MNIPAPRSLVAGIAMVMLCVTDSALVADDGFTDKRFNRIATIPNYLNTGDIAIETVSEIVAATDDGLTLVYTDSENDQVGFVDITNPSYPLSDGTVGVSGEPASVTGVCAPLT